MAKWTRLDEQRAHKMKRQGKTLRQIAESLGRTMPSVAFKLRGDRPKTEICVDCGTAIGAGTKTGRCRACKNAYLGSTPGFCEARAEGLRRKWEQDPCFAARMRMIFREIGRANGTDPVRRAKLVAHGHRMKATLNSPETIAKRDYKKVGAKLHERAMGWCPLEYRAEYKRLTESKRMLAREAKAIVLQQVSADLRKLSPFERQERAQARGGQIVANDRGPSFGEAIDYGEAKWEVGRVA